METEEKRYEEIRLDYRKHILDEIVADSHKIVSEADLEKHYSKVLSDIDKSYKSACKATKKILK